VDGVIHSIHDRLPKRVAMEQIAARFSNHGIHLAAADGHAVHHDAATATSLHHGTKAVTARLNHRAAVLVTTGTGEAATVFGHLALASAHGHVAAANAHAVHSTAE
jgi:hypothetical protein